MQIKNSTKIALVFGQRVFRLVFPSLVKYSLEYNNKEKEE